MSRQAGAQNAFPKSKGRLDDAEVDMDNLDEDQPNEIEDEEDGSDAEGFQDLEDQEEEEEVYQNRAAARDNLNRGEAQRPAGTNQIRDSRVEPVSDPKKGSNYRDDRDPDPYSRQSNLPKQPTGSQDQQPTNPKLQQGPQSTKQSNPPPNLNVPGKSEPFGKHSQQDAASKSGKDGGSQSPSQAGQTASGSKKQPGDQPTYETDHQFQQYLTSLTEYDRSRYNQLLKKNITLREELKNIADQTEALLKKER